jgi:hypothetical protein
MCGRFTLTVNPAETQETPSANRANLYRGYQAVATLDGQDVKLRYTYLDGEPQAAAIALIFDNDNYKMTKTFEKDSLFMHADTLFATYDSVSENKSYFAYHKVRLFKNDLQGVRVYKVTTNFRLSEAVTLPYGRCTR